MTRRRWIIAGSALAVVLVAAFALFRPDKLFVDDTVDEQLDTDVAAAIAADSDGTTTTTTPDPGEGAPTTTTAEATTTTLPEVLGQGEFVSQGGHTVAGSAFVVERPEGRLLVLPELDSENGPDLQLYLSPDASGTVDGGVKLGPLKGNQGTQSYDLPEGVDISSLPNVVIWCERFRTPFGTATLA